MPRIVTISAVAAVVLAAILLVSRADAVPNDVTGDVALGQGNFVTSGCGLTASTMCSPSGVAVDSNGNVYVVELTNNRVLQYDNPLNTDLIADRVFGQGGSFTSGLCNLGGITANSLCMPVDVAVDTAGNLFVVDFQNNRVLEYFTPTSTDTAADRVFGQYNVFTTDTYYGGWFEANTTSADTLTNPVSVAVDNAGNLYIGDRGMHRVLQYNPPLSNTTADRVFGQFGSFTSGLPNKFGVSANSLQDFNGIGVDGFGNLYVADSNNARALMYKTPTTTDTTADVVFGQANNFTTNNPNMNGVDADDLESPTDIGADLVGNVYITDTGTERTLEYDYPLTYGTTADVVFGQGGSMTAFGNNNGGISANSQADPWSITFGPLCNLWIVEAGNNRVTEYDKPTNACVESNAPTPTPTAPVPTFSTNTGVGVAVTVSLNGGTDHLRGGTITFGEVTAEGNTTATTGQFGPPPPVGSDFEVIGVHGHGGADSVDDVDPVYYDLTTTATVSGTHTVCLRYDGEVAPDPNQLMLMHYTAGSWSNITTSINTASEVICGNTTSLSPFAIMSPPISVGGGVEVLSSDEGPAMAAWWIAALAFAAVSAGGALAVARRRR